MDKSFVSPKDSNEKFLNKLNERDIDVQSCYQCGRCSSGCPVGEFFDLSVMEIVRLASYGQENKLVHSHTIWLCAACETCATRCPNSIEIAHLMDVLRELAIRRGIEPAEPRIKVFHESFLGSIKRWGRAYEIGLIAKYKLKSGDLIGDMGLGMQMFSKGKLKLFPHPIEGKEEIREIFSGKGKEYDR